MLGTDPEICNLVLEDAPCKREDPVHDLAKLTERVQERPKQNHERPHCRQAQLHKQARPNARCKWISRPPHRVAAWRREHDSPVDLAEVPALAHQPHADGRRKVEAHLLERQAGYERDASEAVPVSLSEKDERPQGEAEHDRVELEVAVVDQDQSRLEEEEQQVDVLARRK